VQMHTILLYVMLRDRHGSGASRCGFIWKYPPLPRKFSTNHQFMTKLSVGGGITAHKLLVE